MNFFEHQESARKKTGLLVFLLVLAVLCLIVITTLGVGVLLYYLQTGTGSSIDIINAQHMSFSTHLANLVHSKITAFIALGVTGVVTIGSTFKYFQLRRGGHYVAQSLGGRKLHPDSRDYDERKVLNVVEEMAIASGNPVPPVYLMEDDSINAFAAGHNRHDAVIGVTSGCISLLDRNELQGVIAHEFSHIHNGDMRLNMRLVAILNGILLIGLIGYYIMRSSLYTSSYRSRDNKGNQAAILGLALVIIGYGGTFFGNIIKAAVSRQREFLADASAVEFTRDPSGIAGALQKIGGHAHGSKVAGESAAEFSHMYFGEAVATGFNALMATHPPLDQRIQKVQPTWDGKFVTPNMARLQIEKEDEKMTRQHPFSAKEALIPAAIVIADAINSVGDPQPEHIEIAQNLIKGLPESIYQSTHESYSARALVYCLLIDKDSSALRQEQLATLKAKAHPATYKKISEHFDGISALQRSQFITVLELCIPALREMSARQYEIFKKNLVVLIKADNKLSMFEWCYYRIIKHNLEPQDYNENSSISTLKKSLQTLFNFMVNTTPYTNNTLKQKAFAAATYSLDKQLSSDRFSIECTYSDAAISFRQLDKTLNRLCQLRPLDKPKLLKAVGELIIADGVINEEEMELFRAIADTIDCPMPPIN